MQHNYVNMHFIHVNRHHNLLTSNTIKSSCDMIKITWDFIHVASQHTYVACLHNLSCMYGAQACQHSLAPRVHLLINKNVIMFILFIIGLLSSSMSFEKVFRIIKILAYHNPFSQPYALRRVEDISRNKAFSLNHQYNHTLAQQPLSWV